MSPVAIFSIRSIGVSAIKLLMTFLSQAKNLQQKKNLLPNRTLQIKMDAINVVLLFDLLVSICFSGFSNPLLMHVQNHKTCPLKNASKLIIFCSTTKDYQTGLSANNAKKSGASNGFFLHQFKVTYMAIISEVMRLPCAVHDMDRAKTTLRS